MGNAVRMAIVAGLVMSSGLGAQPAPLGGPFQVNTTTTGSQFFPHVATANDRFIVVWQETNGPSGGNRVKGQRLALDGSSMGAEFTLPISDPYAQRDPRVAVEDDGTFVIQWRSSFQSTYYVVPAIRARDFNADTTPADDAFEVTIAINQYGQIFDHDVHPTGMGTFVVGLADYYNSYMGAPNAGVETRRFTPDGTVTGFTSLASTSGSTRTRTERGPNNGFVVAWAEINYGIDLATLHAQRLNPDGTTLGGRISIPTSSQIAGVSAPEAALTDDGAFTVVWSAIDAYYGNSSEIYGRYFDSSDVPTGVQQQINTHGPGSQSSPRIARGGDGRFLVVWQSNSAPATDTDTDGWSIRARQLDATGVPVGTSFQVNDVTTGDQIRPMVTTTDDGAAFFVVWQSESSDGGDTDSWSVRARRYAADAALFTDGFESGDTSAWDATIP